MPQKALKILPPHKHLNRRHQPTLRLPSTPITLTTHTTNPTNPTNTLLALISPSVVAHTVVRINSAAAEGDVAVVHIHFTEVVIQGLAAGTDATST